MASPLAGFVAVPFLWMLLNVLVLAKETLSFSVTIDYVSGTCKTTVPTFNMSNYYNQESILVKDLTGVDVSGTNWDLGKDGAYVGYNVLYCALTPTTYGGFFPTSVLDLIAQKGFNVTQSCNMAGLLSYPAFHVFIIVDRTESVVISDADTAAVAAFYVHGGGIYFLADNCPYNSNINKAFAAMPAELRTFQLLHDNAAKDFPLTRGNPVADNQFGNHVVFAGVASLTSGYTLSIPYYGGVQSSGVFANLCTILIQMIPQKCANEPSASYVRSHATMMYIDPPTQLSKVSGACNWGRIVVDTAWTRYGFKALRTGSWRLAANIVVYLLNIERVAERSVANGDGVSPIQCNSIAPGAADQTQIIGCSSGDAMTLKLPVVICNITFSGDGHPPSCAALLVTAKGGSTCVIDLSSATVGRYWVIVNGQSTSLEIVVTPESLVPRGNVTSVTGGCVMTSSAFVSGCLDGASITIDWTLPYPASFTLGIGSTTSVCSTFSVVGTSVYCQFVGLNTMPRGAHQVYINGVSTGVTLNIVTDIAYPNDALCNGTYSLSTSESAELRSSTVSLTAEAPRLRRQRNLNAALTIAFPVASTVAGLALSSAPGLFARSIALIRLSSCESNYYVSTEEVVLLTGTYVGFFWLLCGVFCLQLCRAQREAADFATAAETTGLPGRAWCVASGIVPSMLEGGLTLVLLAGGSGGVVSISAVSLIASLPPMLWLWLFVTLRFGAAWEAAPRRRPHARDNATSSVVSRYDARRAGRWRDASRGSVPSFVATWGPVFEEWTGGRAWFAAWESALAAATAVVSAVASAGVGDVCNALQVVGGALEMCGLVVLVAARPHQRARALLLAVCIEALGFVGGVCLIVSGATGGIDNSSSSGGGGDDAWATAASVVLQAQFYVGVVLVVADGIRCGRIVAALRRLLLWTSSVHTTSMKWQPDLQRGCGLQQVSLVGRGFRSAADSERWKGSFALHHLEVLINAICANCLNAGDA